MWQQVVNTHVATSCRHRRRPQTFSTVSSSGERAPICKARYNCSRRGGGRESVSNSPPCQKQQQEHKSHLVCRLVATLWQHQLQASCLVHQQFSSKDKSANGINIQHQKQYQNDHNFTA